MTESLTADTNDPFRHDDVTRFGTYSIMQMEAGQGRGLDEYERKWVEDGSSERSAAGTSTLGTYMKIRLLVTAMKLDAMAPVCQERRSTEVAR
jgi:hypothetical protein